MQIFSTSVLVSFFQKLRGFYQFSLIAAFFSALARGYESSATKRAVRRIFGADAKTTEFSRMSALFTRLNSMCARTGRALEGVLRTSVIVKFWRSKELKNSLVFRLLFSRGTQRLLVIIFALYLPVDWILRQYSPVVALASSWDEAFLAFCFVYLIFRRMFGGNISARTTPLDMPVLLFLGLGVLIMTAVMPNASIAIAGLRAVVQYMLWFFVLTRLIESESDVTAFCTVMAGIAVTVAMHGIYQFIVAAPIPSHWVSQAEIGVRTRVFSIFGSPNIMGAFTVMTAPLVASFAYRFKNRFAQVFVWGCVGVICVACLVTFSRGAWLGMAVAVAVFAFLRDRRLLALVVLAAGCAMFVPEVAGRITFLFTDSFATANENGGRAGRWREGMRLFSTANQVFGYGLGRFGGAVAMQNKTNLSIQYFYLDNYYLKTLIEMGYLGLISYAVLMVSTIFTGLRAAFRVRKEKWGATITALVAGMAGVLVHSFTENIFEVPYMNAYFWGMAAMAVWIGFLKKPEKPENA